jgi:hypothetical protein
MTADYARTISFLKHGIAKLKSRGDAMLKALA